MDMEQLKQVLSDTAFVKALVDAPGAETVQQMLAEKGISLTLAQVEDLGDIVQRTLQDALTEEELTLMKSGELSEDELAEAAGGISWDDVKNVWDKGGKYAAGAVAVVSVIGLGIFYGNRISAQADAIAGEMTSGFGAAAREAAVKEGARQASGIVW